MSIHGALAKQLERTKSHDAELGKSSAGLRGPARARVVSGMTLDDVIRDLAATTNEVPRPALQWALDRWEDAGPYFVAMLDQYASGTDRSEVGERALFPILHLAAEKRERAIFPALCRLLLDAEAAEMVLGDGITLVLSRILISTYDGNLAGLQTVIEATQADEFVRDAALSALAYLTRIGDVSEAEMRAYLQRLLTEMQPQEENYVWISWSNAVANLGYEDFSADVERLFRRGLITKHYGRYSHFRTDLEQTLRDPDRMAGFQNSRLEPLTSAVAELENWERPEEGAKTEPLFGDSPVEPIKNPLRGVGRNDPCPCGSGLKYKKCCLV